MSQFGRTLLSYTGTPVRVSADGLPEYKTAGITLSLATIAAVSGTDVTYADGTLVKVGQQALRYGQIITKITSTATQTATITGSPTGGTFTLTYSGQTTSAIAYNAAAATVQAALVALTSVGAGNATVSGSAGGPYTIVFANSLGAAATLTASGASLTGGTSPGVTVAVTVTGGTVGQFGPYDPAAVDGRQTLTRGECFILDETWLANPAGLIGGNGFGTLYPAVFFGGACSRIG